MKKLPYPITLLVTLCLVAPLALAPAVLVFAVFVQEEDVTIEASWASRKGPASNG